MSFKINALYSGAGIIVTYKCTAACLHCCYASSPKRSGAYMERETAAEIFALLNKTGCHSVHIGGGEPFINFSRLLEVCEAAYENGVAIDYIETNASWFKDTTAEDEESVAQKLKDLRNVGVDCLLISVDPFHNEFVPYAKVKGLLKCCEKNNFGTFVWQSKFERIVRRFDENITHTLGEYEEKHGEDFTENIAEVYGLGYNGRALRILSGSPKYKKYNAEYLLNLNDKCPSSVSSLHHFHIDLNGDFIPPGCIGFKVNIFDLCGDGNGSDGGNGGNGLEREKYANYLSVANGSFSGFYERAQTLGFEPKSEGYESKCGLCFDMKKYILEKYEPCDIGPAGFFQES